MSNVKKEDDSSKLCIPTPVTGSSEASKSSFPSTPPSKSEVKSEQATAGPSSSSQPTPSPKPKPSRKKSRRPKFALKKNECRSEDEGNSSNSSSSSSYATPQRSSRKTTRRTPTTTRGRKRKEREKTNKKQRSEDAPAKKKRGAPTLGSRDRPLRSTRVPTTPDYNENKPTSKKEVKRDGRGVYCICRKPATADSFMIQCDTCEEWFHGKCVGVSQQKAKSIESYVCTQCEAREKIALKELVTPKSTRRKEKPKRKAKQAPAAQTHRHYVRSSRHSTRHAPPPQIIRCPCGQSLVEQGDATLPCAKCGYYLHWWCLGLNPQDPDCNPPDTYVCGLCRMMSISNT
eukprot:TRINITY_DN77391_c0_g1_i1.p1 TRINITY_DN77391_c0_g1~~TRINITY_DN77391_c0_g1_i1.p1  ORF type:complete len:344 (+),score=23.14 TRINITY_DN77391_c0_g1_i1:216-1247(+)